jgi:hypothetical protein
MSFLNPFYGAAFAFLPDFLAILAGTLLLWSIALVVDVIPTYGKFAKYAIFALILANMVISVIGVFFGGDLGGENFSLVGTALANSILMIVMGLGLLFYLRFRITNKYLGWIFGYYGYWLGFFLAMGITHLAQVSGEQNFGLDGTSWLLMGWVATTLILAVTSIKIYKRSIRPETIYLREAD